MEDNETRFQRNKEKNVSVMRKICLILDISEHKSDYLASQAHLSLNLVCSLLLLL